MACGPSQPRRPRWLGREVRQLRRRGDPAAPLPAMPASGRAPCNKDSVDQRAAGRGCPRGRGPTRHLRLAPRALPLAWRASLELDEPSYAAWSFGYWSPQPSSHALLCADGGGGGALDLRVTRASCGVARDLGRGATPLATHGASFGSVPWRQTAQHDELHAACEGLRRLAPPLGGSVTLAYDPTHVLGGLISRAPRLVTNDLWRDLRRQGARYEAARVPLRRVKVRFHPESMGLGRLGGRSARGAQRRRREHRRPHFGDGGGAPPAAARGRRLHRFRSQPLVRRPANALRGYRGRWPQSCWRGPASSRAAWRRAPTSSGGNTECGVEIAASTCAARASRRPCEGVPGGAVLTPTRPLRATEATPRRQPLRLLLPRRRALRPRLADCPWARASTPRRTRRRWRRALSRRPCRLLGARPTAPRCRRAASSGPLLPSLAARQLCPSSASAHRAATRRCVSRGNPLRVASSPSPTLASTPVIAWRLIGTCRGAPPPRRGARAAPPQRWPPRAA